MSTLTPSHVADLLDAPTDVSIENRDLDVPTTRRGTLLGRAAAGASWSLIGTSVARLGSLVAAVGAARLLGSGSYGRLTLVQSTVATLGTIAGMGLGLTATKVVSDDLAVDRRAAGDSASTVLALAMISGVVGTVIGLAGSSFVAGSLIGRPDLTTALRIGAPLLLLAPLAEVTLGALAGAQRFRSFAVMQAARGVADAAGIVVGAKAHGVTGGVAGLVAAEALAVIAGIWLLQRSFRGLGVVLRPALARSIVGRVLRFSTPALLGALLLQLVLWLGQVMLARQANGLEMVGLFTVATKWYLAALFVPTAAGTVLLPMLGPLHVASQARELRRLLRASVLGTVALTVPATIVLVVLAPYLLRAQGRSFSGGDRTLVVLALAVVPTAMNGVLSQAALATRRIALWLVSDVVLALVLLVAALVLVPDHGATGLALGYVLAYTATCLVILPVLSFRGVGQQRRDFRPRALQPSGVFGDGSYGSYRLAALGLAETRANRSQVIGPSLAAVLPRPATLVAETCAEPNRTRTTPEAPPSHQPEVRARPARERRSLLPSVLLLYAFAGVVLTTFATRPERIERYPTMLAGPLVFLAVQLVFAPARVGRKLALTPANCAWALFAVQLVLNPALVLAVGPSRGLLTTMPSTRSINIAMLATFLAYLSYAVAFTVVDARRPTRIPEPSSLAQPTRRSSLALVGVGLVGVAVTFRTPGELVRYFSFNGGNRAVTDPQATSTVEIVASLIRPLGAYGFLMLWSRALVQPRSPARIVRLCAYLGGALAILATYNYNRAAIVIPLVAIAATYSRFVRPLSTFVLAGGVIALLVGALVVGNVRRIELGTAGGKYSLEQAGLSGPAPPITDELQVYGAAPQFQAVVIDYIDQGGELRSGRTLINSILSPLPALGEPFRADNGTVEYNKLVYGRPGIADQVIPFEAELYLNFGLVGVPLGFFALGVVLARLERLFHGARSIFSGFIVQYCSIWSAFLIIGSVLVVSQIWIFFLWPLLLLRAFPPWQQPRTRQRTVSR